MQPCGERLVTSFDGVRVLDLSDRLSGAYAARLFGDFGAEVTLGEPLIIGCFPPSAAGPPIVFPVGTTIVS